MAVPELEQARGAGEVHTDLLTPVAVAVQHAWQVEVMGYTAHCRRMVVQVPDCVGVV